MDGRAGSDGWGVLEKRTKTNRGRGGVKPISMFNLLKKLPDFPNSK